MQDNQSRLVDLLEKYSSNTITETEFAEFCEMLQQPENDILLKENVEMGLYQSAFLSLENDQLERMRSKVLKGLQTSDENSEPQVRVHSIHFRRSRWWAAAAILILVGLGTYFTVFNKSSKQDEIVETKEPDKDVKAPESNRAMITLADGRKVYLDSALNGELALQGNVKLVKLANGQIAYEVASTSSRNEVAYNTLNNPRGSKVIDMQLSDGSHVWLNAGSSVTFPIAFFGNERKVSITGEAYFEISHDQAKPFIVSANNKADVTVLGTHFNVNAYDDESDIKVTLLEGSVSVNNTIIKPGQQAQVALRQARGDVKVVNNVSLDEVMAWKNGLFSFNRADIKTVMRQLARWYDVEVDFEGNVPPQLFGGEIQRTVTLSKVLENLEKYGIRSRIENKKIIVLP